MKRTRAGSCPGAWDGADRAPDTTANNAAVLSVLVGWRIAGLGPFGDRQHKRITALPNFKKL
jgi:hypothetical protein